MANIIARVVTIGILVLSLLMVISPSNGVESDIYCLRSIKDSLEDPFNHFKDSWNFINTTEGFICKFVGVSCWHEDENSVLSIELRNMRLKGHFPRGIENCTSLTGLDLSGNELSGPIPWSISESLVFVTFLNISFNNFSGEIPSSIANLSFLNVLLLDNNRLEGHIPTQIGLLKRIKSFSVAHNFLSGPVPVFVNSIQVPAAAYANNPRLCGFPLDPCNKHSDITKFFISGFLVGWALFTVLVLVAVISFCLPKEDRKMMISWFNHIINKTMTRKKNQRPRKKARMQGRRQFWPNTKQTRKHIKISTVEKLITRMSFTDLSEATDSFSQENIIGLGKMGVMYKANLPKEFVAVKRLYDSNLFDEQFTSELMTLGRLRHINLVPLLGFCIESKERLLVYKYMSNGDLYNRLHSVQVETNIMMVMVWPLRVKVAIGVARGLAWLHHNRSFCIVHRNISSKSILLDANFEPMISSFGDATFLKPKAAADSSRKDYMDSEFWELGYVKKDVYGFGIVLLELLTGEEPSKVSSTSNSCNSFNGTSLVEWNTHISECSSSSLQIAIDRGLIGQGFDDEIFQFLKVACDCIQPFSDRRPTMLQVYKILSGIGERYGIADDTDVFMQQGEIS